MSRSRRKTPVFGHTTAVSEADDKRLWHKRWRARERERGELASLGLDMEHLTTQRNAVSSPWDMAKDGKSWFSPKRQKAIAGLVAARRAKTEPERQSLKARLQAKWCSK